ncbi:MAG: hypothetical protein ACJ76H_03490 [Bacteriovoracaceae bacterium]
MKASLALVALFFSFAVFAQEEGDIIKETWTCNAGEVKFTAVITAKKVTASIDAYGSGKTEMNLEKNFTGLEDGMTTKFTGNVLEHDTWDFDATLVRTGEDFEWSDKKRIETKAQMSLITSMFIDCVGNRAAADLIDCKVVIERK